MPHHPFERHVVQLVRPRLQLKKVVTAVPRRRHARVERRPGGADEEARDAGHGPNQPARDQVKRAAMLARDDTHHDHPGQVAAEERDGEGGAR